MYSEEKMDRMYAEDQIEFTNTGRPVRKRYLDQQPLPHGVRDGE